MLYTLPEIALVGLIMTLGSVVQGAVGFASGLLGVPLLVVSGFSLPEAATINLVSTGVQNVIGAWRLWPHLEPRELAFPVVARWLTIPCGTYAAWWVDSYLTAAQNKQLIGVILLAAISLMVLSRSSPRDHLNLFWQALVFTLSGFMLGFASIGGAPLVLYVNSLTWTTAKSRGFLFFCSATGLPVAAAVYWWKHGEKIIPAALATLVVMPLIVAGLWLGLTLGHRLSKPLFRRLTYALLLLVAVSAIVAPLVTGGTPAMR